MLERRRTVTPEQVYAQQAERDIKRRKEADLRRAQELAKKAMAGDDRGSYSPNWQAYAKCHEAPIEEIDIFSSPSKPSNAIARKAIDDYCNKCPVRNECLEEALSSSQFQGIAGGLTDQEVRTLRRRSSKYKKY